MPTMCQWTKKTKIPRPLLARLLWGHIQYVVPGKNTLWVPSQHHTWLLCQSFEAPSSFVAAHNPGTCCRRHNEFVLESLLLLQQMNNQSPCGWAQWTVLTQVKSRFSAAGRTEAPPYLQACRAMLRLHQYVVSKVNLGYPNQLAGREEEA